VRLEAIRTEKHQTRYQPLQPYIDKEAIVKHTQPWQQVLMFFARTQKEHAWKSLQYQFRRQQREAWETLVHEAERAAGGEAKEMDEVDEEMDEADEETDEETEVDETDQPTEAAPEQSNASPAQRSYLGSRKRAWTFASRCSTTALPAESTTARWCARWPCWASRRRARRGQSSIRRYYQP
jgi:hypothetical protein